MKEVWKYLWGSGIALLVAAASFGGGVLMIMPLGYSLSSPAAEFLGSLAGAALSVGGAVAVWTMQQNARRKRLEAAIVKIHEEAKAAASVLEQWIKDGAKDADIQALCKAAEKFPSLERWLKYSSAWLDSAEPRHIEYYVHLEETLEKMRPIVVLAQKLNEAKQAAS